MSSSAAASMQRSLMYSPGVSPNSALKQGEALAFLRPVFFQMVLTLKSGSKRLSAINSSAGRSLSGTRLASWAILLRIGLAGLIPKLRGRVLVVLSNCMVHVVGHKLALSHGPALAPGLARLVYGGCDCTGKRDPRQV